MGLPKGSIMAYLDLRESFAGVPVEQAKLVDVTVPAFEAQEWRVIELARRDHLSSLREPGRLGRLASWLFGERINPRLADPRLETLRHMAVQAWHRGYAVPVSTIKAFKQAGYSMDQLELLLASIGAGRMARSRFAGAN
jgi:hypothetical protein